MKKVLFFLNKINKNEIIHLLCIAFIIVSCFLFYFLPNLVWTFIMFEFSIFVFYKLSIPIKWRILGSVLILGIILPVVGSNNTYYIDIATQIGIYAVLAIGLNIVVGFAGLLDLGYVAFYATGAYLWAIFATSQASNFIHLPWLHFPVSGMWFWLFLPLSMFCAAIMGILLGFPALRLKGDYLAIVTLGFGEIIRIIYNNLDKPINITNGPKGLTPIQPPSLFGYVLNHALDYYFIVIMILCLTIVIAKRLNTSRIGRAWVAIREDEVAARAMGIPVVKMKLLAFAMGASFAGAMGVIFAAKQTFIDPSSFTFMESIGILAMIILGGMGNIPGVILGAATVVILQLQLLKELSNYLHQLTSIGIIHISSELDPSKYERLVFGLILILMAILRPQGLLPDKRFFIRRQPDTKSGEEE